MTAIRIRKGYYACSECHQEFYRRDCRVNCPRCGEEAFSHCPDCGALDALCTCTKRLAKKEKTVRQNITSVPRPARYVESSLPRHLR